MTKPIIKRPLDCLYLVFFSIHLVIIFLVDTTPLYPEWVKPQFMKDIRSFYINNYRDQFFVAPPAWFRAYTWMELLYHAPLSYWVIGALFRDDNRVPLHLLTYSVQTAITTLTCVVEAFSWEMLTIQEKTRLGYLYLPYLALAMIMGVDMHFRLQRSLGLKGNPIGDLASASSKKEK